MEQGSTQRRVVMKSGKIFRIILIPGCFFIVACGSTRHLPEGDKLYTGANVVVRGPSLSVRNRKVLTEDLGGLTRPKPNSKFLGLRLKLNIYNLFYNKKEKSFFGKIRERSGQPPVLLSQVDLEQNKKVLQNHLENKGYFRSRVDADTIIRRRKAHARYRADVGDQYKINTVHFPDDSSALAQNIKQTFDNTLLKPGKPFDLDVIRAERGRIDAVLKEKGFYFFSPEYLLVKTDSTIGNHLVDLFLTVKQGIPAEATEIFRINDVYIYSNYSLNTAQSDTLKSNAEFFKGYYVVDKDKMFKPKLFTEAMKFDPGDVYNRTDHNITLSRLVNLNLFKFVKNRFEVTSTADSARLDAYYYLTPLPRKSLKAEFTTITRSNNLNGSLISGNWKNRNFFHAGEQLSLSAYVGTDAQFSGAFRGYNTYRSGAEMNFKIPRFLIPFVKFRNRGGYVPTTNIQLGYDNINRKKLYTVNSFRFAYGYLWKESILKQHELYPISITYAEPRNVTAQFDSLIHNDTLLARSIEKQLILGSTYQYNYNSMANGLKTNNSFYFNGLFDISGNIAGLVSGANVKNGNEVRIRNVPFAQYIKTELDGRYYLNLGLYSTWASRIIIGIGIPYGNSTQLPFVKQFFVGGNNSLRGFRSRSVGPGTYRYTGIKNFLPDETGDMKLELNTEFRFRLNGPLYGAFFLDAGNVWLINDSVYTHKPGGKFTSKFLSQLAVDAGFGLRFDITLFIIRFDVGFPLRKPWEQNPWVMNQIRLHDGQWRQENIIYNLGIGYPF
jgi:outer membrane protein insertion porin family